MTFRRQCGTYHEQSSEDHINDARPRHAGKGFLTAKDGPQIIDTGGKRWNEQAEAVFLDHLAASCNVTAAAAASGFTCAALYRRRRRDAAFAQRWRAALEQGSERLNALLLQRAIEALEGFAPDPDTPIPQMSVKDALAILGHHRREVTGGPRSRRQWARPRSLDEMRDSILAKLEAVAPAPIPLAHQPLLPAGPSREGEGEGEGEG